MTEGICEKCGGRVRLVAAQPKYGLRARTLHYLGTSNFVGDRCPADRADKTAHDNIEPEGQP